MIPERLTILHILSHTRVQSGGSFQAVLLARAQRSRGHDVQFVYNRGRSRGASESFRELAEEGFACHGVTMQGFYKILGRARLRRLVSDVRPDVIHVHRERALRFALAALPEPDRAVLIAQKGNCYRGDEETACAFRSPRVRRIIAVAAAVKDVLVEADGVSPDKVEVIYGCYDPERFGGVLDETEARRLIGVGDATPLVGLLANLDRKKAHHDFLAAAKRVLQCRPDARFVLVGGGDQAPLRAVAAELGISSAVHFAGFRADVEHCLAAFDVSVNCSNQGEGLTGAIRESLAAARPVVCTDVGGNRELVISGETGVLVAPGDVAALADGILSLLDDPAAAARMARVGQERVKRTMNADVRCDRVLAIYREAIDEAADRVYSDRASQAAR